MADPGFGKGGFVRMCTVATTPPFDAHAHRCNESGCRETVPISRGEGGEGGEKGVREGGEENEGRAGP